ncbi:MAG: zinc-ribbon domain-containing protein [Bryobacteraceae bacterium]
MNCPNCGLANSDDAKFCANCGTRFATASDPRQTSYQPQYAQESPRTVPARNSVMRNIGLGCLVALLIFFFLGLSCTRACFRHRRYYRHYGAVIRPVASARSVSASSSDHG